MDNKPLQTNYLKNFIQDSDNLHKILFLNNPNTVMILNFNGLIINVNDKITKLTGYLYEELIDKSFWELINK